ncbi:MAG: twin-arginine translocase TatA/TatE family subunit [Candidatus Hydrogenedentes bacterium]|nr:twin-arginine translocase TatA/TatE family subunit [Candidatus Hydrogenedentota bacterium]
MFGMPGGSEWIIILLIVLIVFGAGKLPQVGRSLGTAITEFKESVKGKDEKDDSLNKSGDEPAKNA